MSPETASAARPLADRLYDHAINLAEAPGVPWSWAQRVHEDLCEAAKLLAARSERAPAIETAAGHEALERLERFLAETKGFRADTEAIGHPSWEGTVITYGDLRALRAALTEPGQRIGSAAYTLDIASRVMRGVIPIEAVDREGLADALARLILHDGSARAASSEEGV